MSCSFLLRKKWVKWFCSVLLGGWKPPGGFFCVGVVSEGDSVLGVGGSLLWRFFGLIPWVWPAPKNVVILVGHC